MTRYEQVRREIGRVTMEKHAFMDDHYESDMDSKTFGDKVKDYNIHIEALADQIKPAAKCDHATDPECLHFYGYKPLPMM